MRAICIEWDSNDSDVLATLPRDVELPKGMTDEDDVSDWLSEQYGFVLEDSF